MDSSLTPVVTEIILSAAGQLTGFRRRRFQAEMALQYCDGNARRAERVFGWGRDAVATGLGELRTGIRCLDNFAARGRHKTEDDHPELVQQIHALVEPHTQADPQLHTPLGYTRITAAAIHRQLVVHNAGTEWPWRANRNCHGGPLRLLNSEGQASTFDRGLGTHPHTKLTYDLAGKYRRFEAAVGLDAALGKRGRASIRILVDGQERKLPELERLNPGPARLIRIDVDGAKELTLVVDFGPQGDVQADVDWGDARLVE